MWEAFINFLSRPDNVIRNMYYIGYTSAISGGEDGRIFEYLEWTYGAEEEEEEETEEAEEPEGAGETADAEADEEAGDAKEAEKTEEAEESGESDEEPETVEYDVSYFFAGDGKEGEYVLTVPAEQLKRQLSAQYPSEEVIRRASIMICFDEEQNEQINRMWVRVRCFNISDVPTTVWIGLGVVAAGGAGFHFKRKADKEKMYS